MSMNQRLVPVLALLTLIAGAGCAHSSGSSSTITDNQPARPKPKQQLQATTAAAEPSAGDRQAAIDLSNAIADLKDTRVFFAFNEDTLTDEARRKLGTIGDILEKHPNLKIRIEGNCDERGTEEYNLALGQRRADTARKYLLNLGVRDGQVATVSYGEEHPVVDGHTEQAWQQNRRDDVVAVSPN
jgi:peptidoglycan-associated lipoprotein